MTLNLNNCDKACIGCIKSYKKKHTLVEGQKFEVSCNGIPKEYVSRDILKILPPDQVSTALSMLDPVTWAYHNLDWHCQDPDGDIWRRKNPDEYWEWMKNNKGKSILGKSRYHRPYQVEMLRCTGKRKIFRVGRQVGKTETLCVAILFNMFTKPGKSDDTGFKVIVITPYQAQIDLIFTRLEEMINANPNLASSVKRNVKAPQYTITLHNGSEIKGFTAGTKSGGNANAVRGQHGDMLVFDEADYLNAGDMDSALSIITNYPNATVWMSSTPTGRREKFWQLSNSKLYKEFYYPSSVNPMWSEELEKTFREQLTELGYKHEVLAEFGDQEEGVFQNTYVQAAKADYKYGDYSHNYLWTYTIGVDWNDIKNGTTIVVMGFNPTNNCFYVVDSKIISRDGWQQLIACEKIAELNRIWKPVSIYIDRGHGGTQYEVLTKFGYDSSMDPTKGIGHPDAKLRTIVKQYDFGSKIEIRDLFTKQPVEKYAKAFLVENAVRRFETHNIFFPKTDAKLEAQLQNYIIDHVSQTGRPVYAGRSEEIGDHTLDAMMLALVAFTLEKTPFGKPLHRIDIAFSGKFGEKTEGEKGEFFVKPKKPTKAEEPRQKQKPEGTRTLGVIQAPTALRSIKELPANHTRMDGQQKLWAWPGWERDEPAPKPKNMVRSGGRPVRKKI